MATKAELISRLEILSLSLGRDLDTSGSIADLELRVREAEDELGDFESLETANIVDKEAKEEPALSDDMTPSGLVRIRVLKTISVTTQDGTGRWRPEIVSAGRIVDILSTNFKSLAPGLAIRVY